MGARAKSIATARATMAAGVLLGAALAACEIKTVAAPSRGGAPAAADASPMPAPLDLADASREPTTQPATAPQP